MAKGPTLKIRREDLIAKLNKVRNERVASFAARSEQSRKAALAAAKKDKERAEIAIKSLEAKKQPVDADYAWRWDPTQKPNTCNLDRWLESLALDTREEIMVSDDAYQVMFEHSCRR